MAKLAGKAGNVFVASLLLEDCEDAWVSGTNGTASLETSLVKVGSGSAKCVISGASNGDVLVYETISSSDVSTYDHILCWVRTSATVAAADLRLLLDDTGGAVSPETMVDIPAVSLNAWTYCHCTEVGGSEMSESSAATVIGLEMNANTANFTVYLDDIRAAKNVAGIKNWTLDYTTDALESTDFSASGIKAFIAGPSGWSGSFDGFKDGAPLSIGSQVGLELAESTTTTQMWLGNVIITGVHPTTAIDGVVAYAYDFQGTDALRVASA